MVEETDESGFWLEMLADAGIGRIVLLKELLQESKELAEYSQRRSIRKRA